MNSKTLEQRARELLAQQYDGGYPEVAEMLRTSQPVGEDHFAIRAVMAALESTPVQEVELPTPSGPWHATSDDEGYYTYTADQLIAYGQACASARTTPAEGGMTVEQARELITNTIGFGFDEDYLQPVNSLDMGNLAEAFAAATTAPVVPHTDESVDAMQGMMADLGFVVPVRVISEAMRFAIDTARPAKAEPEYDVALIADMLDAYLMASDGEPGAFRGESIEQQATLLRAADNATANARTVKAEAEGDAP